MFTLNLVATAPTVEQKVIIAPFNKYNTFHMKACIASKTSYCHENIDTTSPPYFKAARLLILQLNVDYF